MVQTCPELTKFLPSNCFSFKCESLCRSSRPENVYIFLARHVVPVEVTRASSRNSFLKKIKKETLFNIPKFLPTATLILTKLHCYGCLVCKVKLFRCLIGGKMGKGFEACKLRNYIEKSINNDVACTELWTLHFNRLFCLFGHIYTFNWLRFFHLMELD